MTDSSDRELRVMLDQHSRNVRMAPSLIDDAVARGRGLNRRRYAAVVTALKASAKPAKGNGILASVANIAATNSKVASGFDDAYQTVVKTGSSITSDKLISSSTKSATGTTSSTTGDTTSTTKTGKSSVSTTTAPAVPKVKGPGKKHYTQD